MIIRSPQEKKVTVSWLLICFACNLSVQSLEAEDQEFKTSLRHRGRRKKHLLCSAESHVSFDDLKQTYHTAENVFELLILLLPHSRCWDYIGMCYHVRFIAARGQNWGFLHLGKHTTNLATSTASQWKNCGCQDEEFYNIIIRMHGNGPQLILKET